jgi:hypothetical protein
MPQRFTGFSGSIPARYTLEVPEKKEGTRKTAGHHRRLLPGGSMRLRKIKKLSSPVHLEPKDTIEVHYEGYWPNSKKWENKILISEKVGEKGIYTHVAIMEAEPDDFEGFEAGLGGILLREDE